LFEENFNADSSDVNRDVWTSPEGDANFIGRTGIRSPHWPGPGDGRTPVFGGAANLILSTYSPASINTGNSFWGSEIRTVETYQPGPGGIAFEASVRCTQNIPKGVVTSIFCFGLNREIQLISQNEIEIAFLSNLYRGMNQHTVLLNRFKDEPPGWGKQIVMPVDKFSLYSYNIFKIAWFTDKIEWYINGKLLHIETDKVPDQPMSLRFSIWAPDSNWPLAYDPDLQPVKLAADNVDYIYQIDWVRISILKPQ